MSSTTTTTRTVEEIQQLILRQEHIVMEALSSYDEMCKTLIESKKAKWQRGKRTSTFDVNTLVSALKNAESFVVHPDVLADASIAVYVDDFLEEKSEERKKLSHAQDELDKLKGSLHELEEEVGFQTELLNASLSSKLAMVSSEDAKILMRMIHALANKVCAINEHREPDVKSVTNLTADLECQQEKLSSNENESSIPMRDSPRRWKLTPTTLFINHTISLVFELHDGRLITDDRPLQVWDMNTHTCIQNLYIDINLNVTSHCYQLRDGRLLLINNNICHIISVCDEHGKPTNLSLLSTIKVSKLNYITAVLQLADDSIAFLAGRNIIVRDCNTLDILHDIELSKNQSWMFQLKDNRIVTGGYRTCAINVLDLQTRKWTPLVKAPFAVHRMKKLNDDMIVIEHVDNNSTTWSIIGNELRPMLRPDDATRLLLVLSNGWLAWQLKDNTIAICERESDKIIQSFQNAYSVYSLIELNDKSIVASFYNFYKKESNEQECIQVWELE